MAQRPYALDRLKVEQIVVTERYCRDTAQWKKMRMFWHQDTSQTSLKITWFKGTIDEHIMGSRTMAKRLMKRPGIGTVKHIVNPVDVIIVGDRALCEAYGTINTRTMLNETEYDLSSSATFLFRLVRIVEGECTDWKIASLECVYDKDNLVPVINPPKEPLVIEYPRESYKCLATVLEKSGKYEVDAELPGWDRPAEAQAVLLAARDWAKGKDTEKSDVVKEQLETNIVDEGKRDGNEATEAKVRQK